jgi:hypothetical protein
MSKLARTGNKTTTVMNSRERLKTALAINR